MTRIAQAVQLATFGGTFRIHFNRHGAAPLVWSIATDGWELAVASMLITTPLISVYNPKATADDDDGRPSAWLETTGALTVDEHGVARIVEATR